MMKKIGSIIIGSLFILGMVHAQDGFQPEPCQDSKIHAELVTLNESFHSQGFSIAHFNVITIPHKTFVPVMVNMKQGKVYQLNFIAARDFHKYDVVLVDKDKNEIVKMKAKGKSSEGHHFSQSITPPYTGNYWVIISQNVKGNDRSCIGFSLLEGK